MAPSITAVFVNYRDYLQLDTLLGRHAIIPEGTRVVVVDNTEAEWRDSEFISRWRQRPGVTVLTPGNIGYLGAARHTVQALPNTQDSDFFILSNSDVDLDLAAISAGLDRWRTSDDAATTGIIAPRLIAEPGTASTQPHYWVKPRALKYRVLSWIFAWYPLAVIHRWLGDLKASRGQQVPPGSTTQDSGRRLFAPHGAFMIFTRGYLRSSDCFAYSQFLFLEEIYVGLQAEASRLDCVYVPEITYGHQRHGSMGSVQSRTVVRYLAASHRWAAAALSSREHLAVPGQPRSATSNGAER